MCSIITEMPDVVALRNVLLHLRGRLFSGNRATLRVVIIGAICWAFLSSSSPLQAAIVNAASNSYLDVNTAVNTTAARGDTVVVPAGSGSVTWASTLTITKGVFLKGPGRDALTITSDSTFISISPDSTAVSNEETIRVEGFTFNGNNTASYFIQVAGSGATATKPFKNLAIGNNRFKNSTITTAFSGAISTTK